MEEKTMHRTGILGGTFHPIHNGHLMMARIAMQELALERVWFLPDGMPPHKSVGQVTPQQRLAMTRLAICDDAGFEVCALEIERGGYTYTVDTMREMTKMFPDTQFVQIIGADTLLELENWKDFAAIAGLCSFFVVPRAGTDCAAARDHAEELRARFGAQVSFAAQSSVDISSTQLRGQIEAGGAWKSYVPARVAQFIVEHNLYATSSQNRFDRIADQVRASLPLSRWHHTLGVIETAQALAQRYGEDVERVRLAALLHDCAKAYRGKEAQAWMANYHIKLDAFTQNEPKLWHGPLGAAIARARYGVDDPEILNAVRIHTVGAAQMTRLEKIIKLADLIEPGRTYPGVERLRALAQEDLDEALLEAMKHTMGYLQGDAKKMHPDSVAAINALEAEVKRRKQR